MRRLAGRARTGMPKVAVAPALAFKSMTRVAARVCLSSMAGAPTDLDLLDRWGDGDRTAGNVLFERHFDSLFRFFRNKVDIGVEDLVQQTLLGCVAGRTSFRRDASFRTYLFQVARNQLYAYYRERNREGNYDFEITGIADLGTSPTGLIARKQEEHWLFEALRRIPLHYQVVLELSLWEDMPGRQIAEILDIPEGTLRSRLRLAVTRLRNEMQAIAADAHTLPQLGDDLQAWACRVREGVGLQTEGE